MPPPARRTSERTADFAPKGLTLRQLTAEQRELELVRARLVVALRVKRTYGRAAMDEVWEALGID